MLSTAMEQEDIHTDDGKGSATKDGEGKKRTGFDVEGFLWLYIQ